MLNTRELFELEDALKGALEDNLTAILTKLNRTGKLKDLLSMLGLESLYPGYTSSYKPYGNGKIVVVGASEIKEINIMKIADELGIDRSRFELCLDYKEASKFNYKKMYFEPNYSLIMFGPVHHNGHEKGDYGSVISAIENTEGYPPVIRLGSNELKITKSSFRDGLERAIDSGLIFA